MLAEAGARLRRLTAAEPGRCPRIAAATGYDLRVIVLSSAGYTSSPAAAAALVDLGLHRATDVIGGFHAWAAAGLPTTPAVEEVRGGRVHAGTR